MAISLSAELETILDTFDNAWRTGIPSLRDAVPDDLAGPQRIAFLVELIQIDLQRRWATRSPVAAEIETRAAAPLQIESYLQQFNELSQAEPQQLESLIALEYRLRKRAGDAVEITEYETRFPACDDSLWHQLAEIDAEFPQASASRYVLGERVGTGGMAEVYRVHESQLDRPLAIKMLRADRAGDEALVRRFREEAGITARLQHPGIPPIHERGYLPDGRPFFTMKLINGRTLKECLTAGDVSRAELLDIFEQICETVAYAHHEGVIHRDLKPHNVMVGAFGEVQVMDWGMAKRLAPADDKSPSGMDTIGGDLNSDSANANTTLGTVMGTLAYMPPEQARGETSAINERSDVFALGAILCEILTGKPPYTADNQDELLHLASTGNTKEASRRLDNTDADSELTAIARRCLEADASQRPANASELAKVIADYQSAVRSRLEEEKVSRAAAEAKLGEERKRRRTQLWLLLTMLLLLGGGTVAAIWYQHDQADRRVEAARLETEQQTREARAREDINAALKRVPELRKNYQFDAAEALLKQAKSRLIVLGESDELNTRVRQAKQSLDLVRELDRIRLKKSTLVDGKFHVAFANGPDGEYAQAFRRFGFPILDQDAETVAAKIKQSSVASDIITTLDDWMLDEPELLVRQTVGGVIALAEDNQNAKRLRAITDSAELVEAVEENREPIRSALAVRLVRRLVRSRRSSHATQVLQSALTKQPGDFWLHFTLGSTRALRFSTAARIAHLQAAMGIRPAAVASHINLGMVLAEQERYVEAEQTYRAAISIDPKHAMLHYNLGNLFQMQKRFADAERAYRKAIEIDADHAPAHNNLGVLHEKHRRFAFAEHEYRTAIRIDANYSIAHHNLGSLLYRQKRADLAEAALRKAIEIDPQRTSAHYDLGNLLVDQKRGTEAERAYRTVISIDADYGDAHYALGNLLLRESRLFEAEPAFSDAVRSNPNDIMALTNLANVRSQLGRLAAAEEAYRKALAVDANTAEVHCNFGLMLAEKTVRFEEALKHLRRGHALGSRRADWHQPSQRWVAVAERLVEVDRTVLAIQQGLDPPTDPNQLAMVANFAFTRRKATRLASRLFVDAMKSPSLRAGTRFRFQYNAACAVLSTAGRFRKNLESRDAVKAGVLRDEALRWLRDHHTTWMRLLNAGARSQEHGRRQFRRWFSDPDLASVRGDAIDKLPADEQPGWRKLWEDVRKALWHPAPLTAPRP